MNPREIVPLSATALCKAPCVVEAGNSVCVLQWRQTCSPLPIKHSCTLIIDARTGTSATCCFEGIADRYHNDRQVSKGSTRLAATDEQHRNARMLASIGAMSWKIVSSACNRVLRYMCRSTGTVLVVAHCVASPFHSFVTTSGGLSFSLFYNNRGNDLIPGLSNKQRSSGLNWTCSTVCSCLRDAAYHLPQPLCGFSLSLFCKYLPQPRSWVCVRIAMAGWLHGVFVGDWLFVFPLCGFSLSLFCNYLSPAP